MNIKLVDADDVEEIETDDDLDFIEETPVDETDDEEAVDEAKDEAPEDDADDEETPTDETADEEKDAISKELEAREISKAEETEFSGYVDRLIDDIGGLDAQLDQIGGSVENIGEPVSTDPLDYQTDAEYQRALVKAEMQNARMSDLENQYKQTQERKAQIRADIWDRQAEVGRKKHKDFDAVMGNREFKPTRAVIEAVTSVKNGADIAYHLAKNPRVVDRFSRLSPLAVAVEVGRLSTSLDKPAKRTTKAPPPVKTVQGTKAPRPRSIERMSIADLKKVI